MNQVDHRRFQTGKAKIKGAAIHMWVWKTVGMHIAALCRSRGKPFLVVTQLLHSMIDHPSPTRAEVLDIYNAVLDGADCLMLTGETAQGRYPLESADWLIRVAQEAEKAR